MGAALLGVFSLGTYADDVARLDFWSVRIEDVVVRRKAREKLAEEGSP